MIAPPDAFEVVVDNAVPVVDAGTDKTANEGSAIALDGSFSDRSTEDTLTVSWNFGDENQLTVEHTYIDDGEYTATYTIRLNLLKPS